MLKYRKPQNFVKQEEIEESLKNHSDFCEEEKREEIFSYFHEEAETESVEEAIKFLGEDDYNEEEIRLIRIKFLSEMGN